MHKAKNLAKIGQLDEASIYQAILNVQENNKAKKAFLQIVEKQNY